ncbi:MAG: hypothetical protein WC749_02145 [Dehalococcoidia bacterium]
MAIDSELLRRINYLEAKVQELSKKTTAADTKVQVMTKLVMAAPSSGALALYFLLDQSSPQTVVGTPQFPILYLLGDAAKLYLGAGSDMSMWYDGTDGRIKTDDVAPSDLVVACGAGKTVELANVVYDDLPPVPILSARLGATPPTLATFVTPTEQYTFDATNDYVIGATEITHKYKEGTDISAHIHWATNGVDVGDTGVKWQLDYTVANADEAAAFTSAFGVTAALTIDTLIPGGTADRSHILSVFSPVITGTSLKIGAYIVWKLSRIASATAAPASDPFGLAVGFHAQMDTIGSRTVSTK